MLVARAMHDRILVIEDDEQLGQQILDHLRSAGFSPLWWREGRPPGAAVLKSLRLVILDLMLPGTHGLDVLKTVRAGSDVPVLILSARQTRYGPNDDSIRSCQPHPRDPHGRSEARAGAARGDPLSPRELR